MTAVPPAAARIAGAAAPPAAMNLFLLVFQVTVVLAAARLVGAAFRKIGQPQVIGEMVAGILLGPSLLGRVAPDISLFLFPAPSLGYLNALCQIGLVLFMFLVGASLHPAELRKNGRAAILTSHASIVMPFCLGSALALFLYPRLSSANVSFMNFALFMGAAMSITAFPVLARILAERNLMNTRLGTLAISCAAVDDVSGWCILAYVVMMVRAESLTTPLWMMVGGALVYVAVMLLVVRRIASRFEDSFRKHQELTDTALSWMIMMAMTSALVTERLGIHSLFGAFFMGAILPRKEALIDALRSKLESLTVVAFLPLFFAYSGLRTSIGMVQGELWLYALLVIAVAIAGKFGGSLLAARIAGVQWREASALGILMNTRGLMELVALNIGLDIGVISPTMFAIMVIMALVTTFMTSPLLDVVFPSRFVTQSVAESNSKHAAVEAA